MKGRLPLLLALAALVAVACGEVPGPSTTTSPASGSGVAGVVLAGPVCPVVPDPPESGCEDRPVPGAVIEVVRPDGSRVAVVQSDASGRFALDLAPGSYRLIPQPVEGLLGTAPPLDVVVGAGEMLELNVSYDTGIR